MKNFNNPNNQSTERLDITAEMPVITTQTPTTTIKPTLPVAPTQMQKPKKKPSTPVWMLAIATVLLIILFGVFLTKTAFEDSTGGIFVDNEDTTESVEQDEQAEDNNAASDLFNFVQDNSSAIADGLDIDADELQRQLTENPERLFKAIQDNQDKILGPLGDSSGDLIDLLGSGTSSIVGDIQKNGGNLLEQLDGSANDLFNQFS